MIRLYFVFLFVILSCFFCTYSLAQTTGNVSAMPDAISPEEYIEKFTHTAISEMKRTGIPASVTLAQGLIESRYGNSRLARKANNHFGVKCRNDWKGKRAYSDDETRNECFRRYENPIQSYVDHSNFLTASPRYAFLFVLDVTDYKAWAAGLEMAGYSTAGHYAELLTSLIERYNLDAYDFLGMQSEKLKLTFCVTAACYQKYIKQGLRGKKVRDKADADLLCRESVTKMNKLHRFEEVYEYIPMENDEWLEAIISEGKSHTHQQLAMKNMMEWNTDSMRYEPTTDSLQLAPKTEAQTMLVADKNDSKTTEKESEMSKKEADVPKNIEKTTASQKQVIPTDTTNMTTTNTSTIDSTHSTNTPKVLEPKIASDTNNTENALPTNTSFSVTYIVQKGDTWFGIAKRFEVAADTIQKENNTDKNTLLPGTKLRIAINNTHVPVN